MTGPPGRPGAAPAPVAGGTRWQRLAPGVHVLRRYRREWLRGDVLAGVTVAAYLVPQVMAYAEVAGMPPITGLWAIIGPLLVYAVLGSSRKLSVGPESTTALMTAGAVAEVAGGGADAATRAQLAAVLAIIVGAFCLVGWIARLGFLADALSRPVLVGYMAGVAVLMITGQLGKVTGLRVGGDGLVPQLRSFLGQLDHVHVPTALLAAAMLVLLFGLHAVQPGWPGPLIAMVLVTVVVALFHLQDKGIRLVGAVPRGLPTPVLPDLGGVDLTGLAPAALGIAVVAYSDNVLTARIYADARNRVDGNQELLALGLSNVSAGLLRGFPISSSGSRTVLGHSVGSRTQAYSLVALATVVVVMFFLGPALAAFPTAALGAVVIYAAVRLVEVGEVRRIARFARSELVLAVTTTVGVLSLGILLGIAVAVALSLLDVLRRIAAPHDGVLGYVPGTAGMHDIDDYPQTEQVQGLVVYRYDAPLFFANAENFTRRAMAAVAQADGRVEWLLLNCEANTQLDLTAVDALDELRTILEERGIQLALSRVKHEVADTLQRAGFLDRLAADRVFMTLPTAVQGYRQWYTETHGQPPDGPEPVVPRVGG